MMKESTCNAGMPESNTSKISTLYTHTNRSWKETPDNATKCPTELPNVDENEKSSLYQRISYLTEVRIFSRNL